MINIIAWNCRGAAHKEFESSFKFIVSQNSASLVFIFEPRISGAHARQVIRTLGFTSSFIVDAVGFSGGIWALWKDHEVNISVREHSNQLVHLEWSVDGDDHFFVSGVYDSPRCIVRTVLWDHIRELHQRTRGPWLLCGDFNSIRTMADKVGGAAFNSARCREFNQCADDCQLLDINFTGPRFTWFHGQIRQRLDRAVCNAEWTVSFPEVVVRHLPRIRSDHRPILIHCPEGLVPHRSIRPFRFVAAWLEHDTFSPTLKNAWRHNVPTPAALTTLQSKLRRWNKDIFGNIFQRKKQLVLHLGNLESLNEERPTAYSLDLETKVRRELEMTLWQENVLWRQKSRSNWVSDGDRNTRLFHVATMKRRKHNKITGLRNELGVWVHDQASLRRLACEYFRELFTSSSHEPVSLPAAFQVIPAAAATRLKQGFSSEEVRSSLKKMGPLKAPGKDGFHPVFFQKCWDVVGPNMEEFVKRCFYDPSTIEAVNDTVLVLLPKVSLPERITQFRPIGLCNVVYKLVTKCLANRIQGSMASLVHHTQSSFVPGRHITDNIIILQEVVHSMMGMKGRNGQMILKIDLAKAYDRVEWSFLNDTLLAAGFPKEFVDLTMACVTTANFQVLWNGGLTENFKPTRGLRQGCPLSPYLFTLCIDRLSHLINSVVQENRWKPIKIGRNGPLLSHLFFADDLILFGEATELQGDVVMDCLQTFCSASGQLVSHEKSVVFFSPNSNRELCRNISTNLAIPMTRDLGRYLGVPVLHGRITRNTYQPILDRLDS
ncbi:LINE-1 reverse transcriptase homolog [Linum perenne]